MIYVFMYINIYVQKKYLCIRVYNDPCIHASMDQDNLEKGAVPQNVEGKIKCFKIFMMTYIYINI